MCVSKSNKNWFVLYTKPRCEKKVSEELSKLSIENYCPQFISVKQWSDRKKKVKEPLFKSYVFVYLGDQEKDIVFQVSGVVRYLFWLGKHAIVRNEEIIAIKDFLSEVNSYKERNLEFTYLQELQIVQGPFKGKTGRFLYKRKNQLILEVEALGVAIKAQMHHSFIV